MTPDTEIFWKYDTEGGAPLSPDFEDRPLRPSEFRDLVFNAIAREPSMGDEVDVTDMKNFGDAPGDPHGSRIHITLGTGDRFAVIVKPLAAQSKLEG